MRNLLNKLLFFNIFNINNKIFEIIPIILIHLTKESIYLIEYYLNLNYYLYIQNIMI